MKQNNKIKLLTILFALTFVFAIAMLFVGIKENKAMAENEELTLSIDYFDLSLEDNVYIKFAVDTDDANTTLLVWTTPQNDYSFDNYTKGTEDFELTNATQDTINEKVYVVFAYTELSAKQMTDEIYVRAYSNGNYSEVVKYSILQYAYETLKEEQNDNKTWLLMSMLEYGANAQNYFGYNTDKLANDWFYQVEIIGGFLSDGTTKGLYKSGEEIYISAPATNEKGENFLRWINSYYNNLGEEQTLMVTVGNDDVITAVYGEEGDVSEEEMYAYYLNALNSLMPEFNEDFTISYNCAYNIEYSENDIILENRTRRYNEKQVLSFENETGAIYYIDLYEVPESEIKEVGAVTYVVPNDEDVLYYEKEYNGIESWSFVTENFASQVYKNEVYYILSIFIDVLSVNYAESISDLMASDVLSNVSIINNKDNTFTLKFDFSDSRESDDWFYSKDDEFNLPCTYTVVDSFVITFNENKLLSISVEETYINTAIQDENTYSIKSINNYTITFTDNYDSETITSANVQIPTGEEYENIEFLQFNVYINLMDVGVFDENSFMREVSFTKDYGSSLSLDEIVYAFENQKLASDSIDIPENCTLEIYSCTYDYYGNENYVLVDLDEYTFERNDWLYAKIVPNEGFAFVDIEYKFSYKGIVSGKEVEFLIKDYAFEVIEIDAEKEPYIYTIPTNFNELETMFDIGDRNYEPNYQENYKVVLNSYDITGYSEIELYGGNSYNIRITMMADQE